MPSYSLKSADTHTWDGPVGLFMGRLCGNSFSLKLDDSRVTAAEGLAEGDAVIYTFTSTSGNVGTIKVEKK